MSLQEATEGVRIGRYFNLWELCRSEAHLELAEIPPVGAVANLCWLARVLLDPLREEFGAIHVNSGYRPAAVNKAIGGAANSDHMKGLAADIVVMKWQEKLEGDRQILYRRLLVRAFALGARQAIIYPDRGPFLHVAVPALNETRPRAILLSRDGNYEAFV